MKNSGLFPLLFSLLPAILSAQSPSEEEKLFAEEASEERFFKLEEEAVTIASKHAQSAQEAPASITVLTADEIFRYGFRDLSDLLRTVSGWYLTNGYDYAYAGVRGMLLKGDQNTRILLLVDGHTQNEAWSSTSNLEETLGLDLRSVSRVEILQGPSSTLYGTNAFLGIINLVTRSGAEQPRVSGHLDLGSFGYTRATVASGMERGPLKYHARASVVGQSGRYLYFPERAETSDTAGFTSPPSDAMRGYSGFLKVQLKDLRLLGLFAERFKHIPTAPYNTVLDSPHTFYEQKRWFLELQWSRQLTPILSLMARVFYDGYRIEDKLPINASLEEAESGDPTLAPEGTSELEATPEPIIFRDIGAANWAGAELQAGVTLLDRSQVRDQLFVGAEASWQSTRSRAFIATSVTNDAADPSFAPVDIPTSALGAGVYLQNELEIARTVNFITGLRFDYNSNFIANTPLAQTLSPRGALVVRTRNDSTFKLIYARGFRNPSVYEAYYDDREDITANLELKPESIQNFELVYEYRLKKMLRVSLANYYFRATDPLKQETVCYDAELNVVGGVCSGTEGDTRQQFRNVAAIEGLGSEISAVAALPFGLNARATLALQKSADLDSGEQLINSPAIVSNLLLNYPLIKDKAFIGGSVHFVSGRVAGADAEGETVSVPAYALANLVFSARNLRPGLEIQAGVHNLLDAKYRDVSVSEKIVIDRTDVPVLTIPTDGRTFAFNLSYRY